MREWRAGRNRRWRPDVRLQFEIHRHKGVLGRFRDVDFRRQIVSDGERAFIVALRRKTGRVHDRKAQPTGIHCNERAAHFIFGGWFQGNALRRLVARRDFERALLERAVGLHTKTHFTARQCLDAFEGVRFFLAFSPV